MSRLEEELRHSLERLRARGLGRQLELPRGIDFSSNDYLGLARDPALREGLLERLRTAGPLAAPASRLLRGNLREHLELEERLARFKGTEAALLFPSGYQANLGLIPALAGPRDRLLLDRLDHASLLDAARLSGARRRVYPHLDLGALEAELRRPWPGGRTIIVTESLFSMDGDIAPLDRIAELAERHGASLVVDDAHATGLWGPERASGLVEELGVGDRVAAIVSTFGKALGSHGAFVAASRAVVDWLVARSRAFIFSTAAPPLMLHAQHVALDLLERHRERGPRARALAERLRASLRAAGLGCLGSEGPIVPVLVGENQRAVAAGEKLRRAGFDVRGIRPPTVPAGTARLRISVHADHREREIDALARAVIETLSAG